MIMLALKAFIFYFVLLPIFFYLLYKKKMVLNVIIMRFPYLNAEPQKPHISYEWWKSSWFCIYLLREKYITKAILTSNNVFTIVGQNPLEKVTINQI